MSDTSYPTIRCLALNGAPCLKHECPAYQENKYARDYYDKKTEVPNEEKYDIVTEKNMWGTKIVKTRKPEYQYSFLSYYKYHVCLKVWYGVVSCNHKEFGGSQTTELSKEEVDETRVGTDYEPMLSSIECYDSSPTTNTPSSSP